MTAATGAGTGLTAATGFSPAASVFRRASTISLVRTGCAAAWAAAAALSLAGTTGYGLSSRSGFGPCVDVASCGAVLGAGKVSGRSGIPPNCGQASQDCVTFSRLSEGVSQRVRFRKDVGVCVTCGVANLCGFQEKYQGYKGAVRMCGEEAMFQRLAS